MFAIDFYLFKHIVCPKRMSVVVNHNFRTKLYVITIDKEAKLPGSEKLTISHSKREICITVLIDYKE